MILEKDVSTLRFAIKDLEKALTSPEWKSTLTCVINDLDRLADKLELRMLREVMVASGGLCGGGTRKQGVKP